MSTASDFFTLGTMVTLSGATGSTFVVCNGIQKAFNFNPRWLALLVAQIIVLGGAYAVGKRELLDYFVGVINGFLVFCSAAGASGVLGTDGPVAKGPVVADLVARGVPDALRSDAPLFEKTRRSFLSKWF